MEIYPLDFLQLYDVLELETKHREGQGILLKTVNLLGLLSKIYGRGKALRGGSLHSERREKGSLKVFYCYTKSPLILMGNAGGERIRGGLEDSQFSCPTLLSV